MTFDHGKLYNKFHTISIGLRTLERLIGHREDDKTREVMDRLKNTSDGGMEYLKEMNELQGG